MMPFIERRTEEEPWGLAAGAVPLMTQFSRSRRSSRRRQLVVDAVVADGLHCAADIHGGREDLGVVLLARAAGEAGGEGVGALERGVGEDGELEGVGEGAGGRAAVAADHGEVVAADAGDLDDFGGVAGADKVADLETGAVVHGDGGRVGGVGGEDGLVDGVGVGEEGVLEPLVDGVGGGALGVAKVREERGFERGDDADDVGDILHLLGEGGACVERGLAGEAHEWSFLKTWNAEHGTRKDKGKRLVCQVERLARR
jgi:hypothetical protein